MKVSQAKVEDIAQIVTFAYSTYKDVELTASKVDFEKVADSITKAVVRGVPFVIRNPENDDEILACLLLGVTSSWWSNEKLLEQLFFYVKPEIRGSKAFALLLDSAKEYGIMNDLPVIQGIVGKDAQRKGNVLLRRGYESIGHTYMFNKQDKKES